MFTKKPRAVDILREPSTENNSMASSTPAAQLTRNPVYNGDRTNQEDGAELHEGVSADLDQMEMECHRYSACSQTLRARCTCILSYTPRVVQDCCRGFHSRLKRCAPHVRTRPRPLTSILSWRAAQQPCCQRLWNLLVKMDSTWEQAEDFTTSRAFGPFCAVCYS